MPAATLDLLIEQGATWRRRFLWRADGVPVDLSGHSARMQIRRAPADGTVLAELSSDNGALVLGGAAGTIDLHLSAERTAAFGWRSGVYDLEIRNAAGDVVRLLAGAVAVSPEVTR